MRLLTWSGSDEINITDDLSGHIPPYAILSHTWGPDNEEVIFSDLQKIPTVAQSKAGYSKLRFCGEQSRRDGIEYFWIDTCCINKDSHSELSEAITSMFRWYQYAVRCYVYLSDVSASALDDSRPAQCLWETSFRNSRWFTRGWTLQELLAPRNVQFFASEGIQLGDKGTLTQLIHEITSIPVAALQGTSLSQFSVVERMRWTQRRATKKQEDQAYCLLGIFGVYMPLIYGEGDNALHRLRREIDYQSGSKTAAHHDHVDVNEVKSLGINWGSAPLIGVDEFIGRAAEIDRMVHILQPGKPTTEQRRLLLGGMGGIGKTQLAIAYARGYHTCYTSVLWLNATSEQTLKASFRLFAKLLLSNQDSDNFNDDDTVRVVLRWLSLAHNKEWLLIMDNHDDVHAYTIQNYLPQTTHGSVLITTRLPDMLAGQRIPQVRLSTISELQEAVRILETRSRRKNVADDPDACRLARRLDGLPLALATAGAYLCKTSMTFGDYVEVYERRFNINPRRPTQLQEYQDRTLYTTWDLSYHQLERDDTLAAKMLPLLAYFDNQQIWYELLRAGLRHDSPVWLQEATAEHVEFDNVMGTLVDYCLLEAHPSSGVYSLHNCVHDWTRARLNQSINAQHYWYALRCVTEDVREQDIEVLEELSYAPLARHALRLSDEQLFQAVLQTSLTRDDCYELRQLGNLLFAQDRLSAAERLYLRSLAECERSLGPDHIATHSSTYCLAVLYHKQNRLHEAERMYHRARSGIEIAYGPDDASTLNVVNNLANLYVDQGKLGKAEQTYIQVLARTQAVLGPNHIETLSTVNNLGIVYEDQGKFDQAEEMYQQAISGIEKAMGPDHLGALDTIRNLAMLYNRQGKLDDAERMYLRALTGYRKQLGQDHRSTRELEDGLADFYRKRQRTGTVAELPIDMGLLSLE